jgi:hypothetical protein
MSSEVSGMDRLLVNFSIGGARNCRSSSVIPVSRKEAAVSYSNSQNPTKGFRIVQHTTAPQTHKLRQRTSVMKHSTNHNAMLVMWPKIRKKRKERGRGCREHVQGTVLQGMYESFVRPGTVRLSRPHLGCLISWLHVHMCVCAC